MDNPQAQGLLVGFFFQAIYGFPLYYAVHLRMTAAGFQRGKGKDFGTAGERILKLSDVLFSFYQLFLLK